MANYIENRFSNWVKLLNSKIKPGVFTQIYDNYRNDFSPFLESYLKDLYVEIKKQFPNIDFFIRGRFKSEASYLNKVFLKLNSAISSLFDSNKSASERLSLIEKYFGFLRKTDAEKYSYIVQEINRIAESKRDITNLQELEAVLQEFEILTSCLSPVECEIFTKNLAETDDIFAYKIVIRGVKFNIKSICEEDGIIKLLDENGNYIPISTSIKINPNQIKNTSYGKKYIEQNGSIVILSDRDFLYDSSVPAKKRTFENAKIDSNGNVTIFRDAFVLPTGELFNIDSIFYSDEYKSYFFSANGELRNLSTLIDNNTPIQLLKSDSKTCIQAVYDINSNFFGTEKSSVFLKRHNYQSIPGRFKDYIKTPKSDSNYQSLHDSFRNSDYGFSIEGQLRTLSMEDDTKNESEGKNDKKTKYITGHDNYKRLKIESKLKYRPILRKIKAADPTAFDSSAATTMKLLSLYPIHLSEVLPKYIIITSFSALGAKATSPDMVSSFVPEQDLIFSHFFKNVSKEQIKQILTEKGISFYDYQAYVKSSLENNTAIYSEEK